jgi:hypothetical protein
LSKIFYLKPHVSRRLTAEGPSLNGSQGLGYI